MPFFIVQVLVFLIQALVFVAGVDLAWGIGTPLALLLGLAISLVPKVGRLLLASLTFYGAYAALGWPWWQALIVAAPGVALPCLALAFGATAALLVGLGLPRR